MLTLTERLKRGEESAYALHRAPAFFERHGDGKGVNGESPFAVKVGHGDAELAQLVHEVEGEQGELVVFRGDGEGGREVCVQPIDGRDFALFLLGKLAHGRAAAICLRIDPAAFEARGDHRFEVVDAAVEDKPRDLLAFGALVEVEFGGVFGVA